MRYVNDEATKLRRDQGVAQRRALRSFQRAMLVVGLLFMTLMATAALPVGPAGPDEDYVVDAGVRPAEVSQRLRPLPTRLRVPDAPARVVELEPTGPAPHDSPTGPALDIGYLAPAPPLIVDSTPWIPAPDGGWIKRLELHSPGATALRAVMTDLYAAELRVYDPEGDAVFGPYRYPRLDEADRFWSTVIFGDTIGLELYHGPSETDEEPTPVQTPEITDVFHMHADFAGLLGDPRDGCMQDISCQPSWKNSIEGRAVALLMQSTGCSGAMLNRSPSDQAPILMTAQHCINNQSDANNLVVVWFWETATCNGVPPNLNTLPRNDGSLLLKTHVDSDWTLVGLYEPDRSGNYCGWSNGYWDDDSPATGIHHPGGNPKSISFGRKANDTGCAAIPSDWQWEVQWSSGAITGGSSGSPIFDANRRVRGTLSCGACAPQAGPGCDVESRQDPCSPYGKYGRLDAAYPIVRWYINGMANPAYVDRGVGGDPGNQGSTERGTSALPFNTVYEGTFCVPAGGTLRIKPGNYNERFRIWRPMRMEPSQSGIARIGTP